MSSVTCYMEKGMKTLVIIGLGNSPDEAFSDADQIAADKIKLGYKLIGNIYKGSVALVN